MTRAACEDTSVPARNSEAAVTELVEKRKGDALRWTRTPNIDAVEFNRFPAHSWVCLLGPNTLRR